MTNPLTQRETRALLYAAVAAYGWMGKGWLANAAKVYGLGLLLTEALGYAQDQQLFQFPETMNAFFRTDGKISGKQGAAAAKVIRRTKVVT